MPLLHLDPESGELVAAVLNAGDADADVSRLCALDGSGLPLVSRRPFLLAAGALHELVVYPPDAIRSGHVQLVADYGPDGGVRHVASRFRLVRGECHLEEVREELVGGVHDEGLFVAACRCGRMAGTPRAGSEAVA